MRELNECTAEVFRRSEKRIMERRKARNRILALCIPLCVIVIVWSAMILPDRMPAGTEKIPGVGDLYGGEADGSVGGPNDAPGDALDGVLGSRSSFSFSLTWNCYGVSSYDSATGKLVKTKDATYPDDFITNYQLTEAQKQRILDWILDLNVMSYPDRYDPHKGGLTSNPSMTLILSVKTDTIEKTITAADIALSYESGDPEGQKFLSVCKAIQDMLTETDAWKALPEYEFFYN